MTNRAVASLQCLVVTVVGLALPITVVAGGGNIWFCHDPPGRAIYGA